MIGMLVWAGMAIAGGGVCFVASVDSNDHRPTKAAFFKALNPRTWAVLQVLAYGAVAAITVAMLISYLFGSEGNIPVRWS